MPRLAAPLIYAGLSAYGYGAFLANPRGSLPGVQDGLLYAWYFTWIEHSVVHLHNPFVSNALNAPYGFNVMWNTSLFLIALLCVPLTAALGPFTTVGMLFVISPFVSAWALYAVLRRIGLSSLGAFIAGLLYAFGPFFTGHHGHLNLILAPFPPIFLLLLYRLIAERDRSPVRVGVVMGVAVGAQFLIAEEILVLSFIAALGGMLALALTYPRSVRSLTTRVATGLGVAAAVALGIAAIPVGYQLFGPHALSGVSPGTARADVASLVRPSLLLRYASSADIHANLRFGTANGAENTAYLGWPIIALVVGLLAWLAIRRDRFAVWWALTTSGLVVLTVGSPIFMNGRRLMSGPWALIRAAPFVGGVNPVRFSLLTMMLIGVLIAYAFSKVHGAARVGLLGLVVIAALLPLTPVEPHKSDPIPATPRFFTSAAVMQIPTGSNVLVLPASFVYWPIALVLAYVLIVAFDLHRSRARGLGSRIRPYAIAGTAIAVCLTAASIWAERSPLVGRYNFLGWDLQGPDVYRVLGPAGAIGLGLLVLAAVERNVALLTVTIGYLVIVVGGITFGWTITPPSPWGFAPHLVIDGGLLLLTSIAFALAQRRASHAEA